MPLHVSIVSVKTYKYVRVFSSYRNEQGKPRSRLVENHGRLDALLQKDPDYVEKLKARIAKENELEVQAKARELEIQAKKRMDKLSDLAKEATHCRGCFQSFRVGAALIRKVWCDLKLPEMFRYLQQSKGFKYPYDQTAYLLTEQRLLNPTSKLKTFELKSSSIIDHSQIDHVDDLYKVLDALHQDKKTIIRHLNREITKRTKRKVSAAFYDVTTYAFESRQSSEYKDFGLSKDHKVNEVQVVLGLVMDENGIPIDYELFNGSTNEFGTMVPLIKKIKKDYDLDRLIVVADRGLNSSENLFALKDIGCDFVIAQKFKTASAEIREQIMDQGNWQQSIYDEDGQLICHYKSLEVEQALYETRQSPKTLKYYKTKNIIDTMKVHWIVSYSPARAHKDQTDRERAVAKAQKAVEEPQRLKPTGYKALVKQPKTKGTPCLNWEKISEQARWDGYYVICTNLSSSPAEVSKIYRKLWQIEDCFRVSKSQLEARPCFVWTDPHIYGHFLSCFVSLTIEKYMLFTLKQAYGSAVTHEKMLHAMREVLVVYDDINPQLPLFLKLYENQLFDQMCEAFGLIPLNKVEKPSNLKRKLRLPNISVVATKP